MRKPLATLLLLAALATAPVLTACGSTPASSPDANAPTASASPGTAQQGGQAAPVSGQGKGGGQRMQAQVLAKLTGKNASEITALFQSGKSLAEVLQQLGVTQDQYTQAMQQAGQGRRGSGANQAQQIQVLAQLSNKSTAEVKAMFAAGTSFPEIVKQLGLTMQQVRQAMPGGGQGSGGGQPSGTGQGSGSGQ